jgi:hypothetical protein
MTEDSMRTTASQERYIGLLIGNMLEKQLTGKDILSRSMHLMKIV